MPNIIALRAIALLVLLPSTLVAGFFTFMGLAFVAASLGDGEYTTSAVILLAAMVAGWFGLVTAWRLYDGMHRGHPNLSRPTAWAGLACGCVTSVGLIATTGGSIGFRLVFFGWPLLAAAFFAIALKRPPHAT